MEFGSQNIVEETEATAVNTAQPVAMAEKRTPIPVADSSKKGSEPQPMLITPDLVSEVCSSMQAAKCLPDEARQSISQAAREAPIQDKLSFLNDCLPTKGRFPSAAAEKAWGNFHRALQDKISELSTDIGLSRAATFQLCLRLFKRLVQLNYFDKVQPAAVHPFQQAGSQFNLDEHHSDILEYIGGSIVHKIEKQLKRHNKSKAVHFDIVQCLKQDQVEEAGASSERPKTMTSVLDRGGLVHVKPSVTALLEQLECPYRSKCSTSDCSSDKFVSECLGNEDLTTSFYNITYDCTAEEEDKEYVLEIILQLFHKIRIHHTCKDIKDMHKSQKHLPGKQKGLKKTLKAGAACTDNSSQI